MSALYTTLVCGAGVPALRHDWAWPSDRSGFIDFIVASASGWSTAGLGSPHAYPGAYLIGALIGITGAAIGSLPTLVMFMFSIGVAITVGVNSVGSLFGTSRIQIIAAQIFALFNPWIYNKTVAGHVYMLLAYGAFILLLAELLAPAVRVRRVALLLALILPQVQFFLIALIAISIHALSRRVALPLLTSAVIALPVLLGVLLDRSALLNTPYTLTWENTQSVIPAAAPVLAGYFAKYAHLNVLQLGAAWFIVFCVALSAIMMKHRALALATTSVTALFLLIAMGTHGPLGVSYATLVLHIPESGVFRELYDLLGLVAIGYIVMLAWAPLRPLGGVVLAASVIVASIWFTEPPSRYWVPLQNLPDVSIRTSANTRFAMMPPYQPMRFQGQGSGIDPSLRGYPSNVTPLNQYLATFPVNVALSNYALTGDTRALQDLSVSVIISRPFFSMDLAALRSQGSVLPDGPASVNKITYRKVRPIPEVVLQARPAVAGLANLQGYGNIFFGDAIRLGSCVPHDLRDVQFLPIRASNAVVSPAHGWTSAGFLFAAMPSIGQGIGGAATINPDAILDVIPGMKLLVNVQGVLHSSAGDFLSGSTGGYRWIKIPANVHGLRCNGLCIAVGETNLHHIPDLNPPGRRWQTARFKALAPWLLRVIVPPHSLPVLRYNAMYERNWIAYTNGRFIRSIRLDTTVNGWLLGEHNERHIVYLCHVTSVLQAIAEVIAALWLLIVAISAVRETKKCNRPLASV